MEMVIFDKIVFSDQECDFWPNFKVFDQIRSISIEKILRNYLNLTRNHLNQIKNNFSSGLTRFLNNSLNLLFNRLPDSRINAPLVILGHQLLPKYRGVNFIIILKSGHFLSNCILGMSTLEHFGKSRTFLILI